MDKETLRMQMLACVITESEYVAKLEEASSTTKLLRKLGWAGEDLTPKEIAAKIKELPDDTLIAWSKDNNGIPNTPLAFQQKLVKIEMDKRGLDKASLNESMIGGIVGIGAINQIPSRAKADYEDAFEYFLSQKYSLNEEVTSNDMINFVEQNFDTIKSNFLKSEIELIKDSAEDEEDEKNLMNYLNDSLNKATDASSLIDVINERSIGIDLSNPKEVEELFNEIKGYASLEEGKEVEEPTNY